MRHVVRHDLDPEQARRALHKAWETYAERFSDYNPTATWQDEDTADIGFSAKGIKLTGTLSVQGKEIVMDMKVPLLLRAFQGRAVQVIDEEINRWVGKAKNGDL